MSIPEPDHRRTSPPVVTVFGRLAEAPVEILVIANIEHPTEN